MILRFQIVLVSLLLVALNGCRYVSIGSQYPESRIRHYETQTGLVKRYTQLLEVRLEDASSTNLTVLSSNDVEKLFQSICEVHAHISGLSEYHQEVCHLNGEVIVRLAEPISKKTVFEDASWTPLYVDYLGYTNNVARPKGFILTFPSDKSKEDVADIY